MQKSSNGRNVTFISMVVKRPAAESLPKNQTSESLSPKILAKESLFQTLVGKKSDGQKYYIKSIHRKVREQTKNHGKK